MQSYKHSGRYRQADIYWLIMAAIINLYSFVYKKNIRIANYNIQNGI